MYGNGDPKESGFAVTIAVTVMAIKVRLMSATRRKDFSVGSR